MSQKSKENLRRIYRKSKEKIYFDIEPVPLQVEPMLLQVEPVLLQVEPMLLQVELMPLHVEPMLLRVETTNGYLLNLQVKKLIKELIPKRGRMIAVAKQGDAVAKNSELRSPEHLLERKKETWVLRTPSFVNGLYTPLGLPVIGEQKRLSTYWSARRREGAGMDDGFLLAADNGVGRQS